MGAMEMLAQMMRNGNYPGQPPASFNQFPGANSDSDPTNPGNPYTQVSSPAPGYNKFDYAPVPNPMNDRKPAEQVSETVPQAMAGSSENADRVQQPDPFAIDDSAISNPHGASSNAIMNAGAQRIISPDQEKMLNEQLNAQAKSIPELEEYQKAIRGMPVQTDLSPLLALSDSLTGSKLAGSYTKPQSGQERVKSLADIQKMTQDQRNKLAEDLTKIATAKGQNNYMARLANTQDLLQQRQEFTAHKDLVDQLSKDKELGQRLGQYRNLDNALSTIVKAKNLTPQQIDEFQQAVRSNLGIKGTSGVDERSKTLINTMGLNAARFEQFLSGDPEELSKNSTLVNHLKDLASIEQNNIRKQMQGRISAVSSGMESLYARRPDLKRDLTNKIKAVSGQFTSQNPPDDMVSVVSPDGTPGSIPKANLQKAILKGYKVKQ